MVTNVLFNSLWLYVVSLGESVVSSTHWGWAWALRLLPDSGTDVSKAVCVFSVHPSMAVFFDALTQPPGVQE